MFDDGHSGCSEVSGHAPGRISVQNVVIGQFLATELFRPGNAGVTAAPGDLLGIEGRHLVRVFSVAEPVALFHGHGHLVGETLFTLSQILGNGSIICRHMLEGLLRQFLALFWRQVSLAQFFQNYRIVRRVNNDDDAGEIFGRRPNHGRPANINVFQRLFQANSVLGHRLDKRVEVDRHQVNRFNLIFL